MTTGAAEDIRDYLVAQGVTGLIMVGVLPTSLTAGIGVLTYYGHAPILAMGTVVERRVMLQVHIRGEEDGVQALITKAEQVFSILAFAINVSINGHTYDKIVANNDLIQMKPETNELPGIMINIEAWKRGL